MAIKITAIMNCNYPDGSTYHETKEFSFGGTRDDIAVQSFEAWLRKNMNHNYSNITFGYQLIPAEPEASDE